MKNFKQQSSVIFDKTFIVSTHEYATGPAQDLKKYLIDQKVHKLLFIGHPLFHNKQLQGSGYEYFEKGSIVRSHRKRLPHRKANLVDYFLHVLRCVYWAFMFRGTFDVFVGSDNVNAFAGVLLKKLGKVRKAVYYVIDYNPHRFQNRFMNYIYHLIDRFCVKNADTTWNLSSRMEQARKKYFGFVGGNQKVVPLGVWVDRIRPRPCEEVEKKSVVFMGHVTKKQGIQHVIKEFTKIARRVPGFRFLVIGDGDYLETLKLQSSELGVSGSIEFLGYINDAECVEEILTGASLAVALYDEYDEQGNCTFTYFADPAKIKLYLACGLPVLTSRFIKEMPLYRDKDFIVAVDDTSKLTDILFYTLDRSDLCSLREAAVEFMRNYNWDNIFGNALEEL